MALELGDDMRVLRGAEAIALLSGGANGGEINIVCPYCKEGYTHVSHVGTLVGTDDNEATEAYDGTSPSGVTPSRRSAVEIVLTCEICPKPFALVIQQHKGNSLVEIHVDLNERKE